MELTFSWFIFILFCIECFSIQREMFHVSKFGAYPNDNIDDSIAIQSAVNAAISIRLNSTVIFGYGIYNLFSTINIINATNLTIT